MQYFFCKRSELHIALSSIITILLNRHIIIQKDKSIRLTSAKYKFSIRNLALRWNAQNLNLDMCDGQIFPEQFISSPNKHTALPKL
jgi:hypothetical protein